MVGFSHLSSSMPIVLKKSTANYGDAQDNIALKAVGGALLKTFRLGGEEFSIVGDI